MSKQVFILRAPPNLSRPRAKLAIEAAADGFMVTIADAPKTRAQEEKYHAMIGEIAAQAKHLGATWGAEDWKRLLLDKFARETGRSHGKVIPNLDGNGVVEVGILSRKFGLEDGSEFIEFLNAWAAEHGIEFAGEVMA